MASLLWMVNYKVGRHFNPGPTDLIDNVFDNSPKQVTVNIYPKEGATTVTGATAQLNGNPFPLPPAPAGNPMALTFNLGGNANEHAGDLNTLTITATDDNATAPTSTFSISYFRRLDQAGATTTTAAPTATTTAAPGTTTTAGPTTTTAGPTTTTAAPGTTQAPLMAMASPVRKRAGK